MYGPLFDLSPGSTAVTSRSGTVIAANKSFQQLFGLSSEQILGQQIQTVVPAADDFIRKATSGATETMVNEYAVRGKNGRDISVELQLTPFVEDKQHLLAWFFKDLSDKKQLLHDLQERIKEQLSLLRVTETFFRNQDLDKAFHDCLPHIQNGWQYPDFTSVRISLKNGKTFQTENFSNKEDGLTSSITCDGVDYGTLEVKYTASFPLYGDSPFLVEEKRLADGLASLLGLYAGQWAALKQIRDNEQFITHITSQIPGNAYQFEVLEDGKSIVHFASKGQENPGGNHPTGGTRYDWFVRYIHPDDARRFQESVMSCLKENKDINIQFRIVVDGNLSWRWLTARPEKNGDRVLWYGYTQDVTQFRKYVETLEQILFDISHVMRRPVSSMLGLVGLVDVEILNEKTIRTIANQFKEVASEMDNCIHRLNKAYSQQLNSATSRLNGMSESSKS